MAVKDCLDCGFPHEGKCLQGEQLMKKIFSIFRNNMDDIVVHSADEKRPPKRTGRI